MAGTSEQNTAPAAGTTTGTSSEAGGSPATTPTLNPLAAAIAAEMAGEAEDPGGQTGGSQDGTGATGGAGTNQAGADNGNGEGQAGTSDGTEGEGDATTDELPEEIDPEKPPRGLEGVPKPVWKRIQKQSEKIRDLNEQLGKQEVIQIAPLPDSPLSGVTDMTALQAEIRKANGVRTLLGGFKAEDYTDDGKGGKYVEVTLGDQVFRYTEQRVSQMLAHANAVLDPEAMLERQQFLQKREEAKPQLAAEEVLPGVLKKGTPANDAYIAILQSVPELAHRLPNFEYVIACMVRGETQFKEEKGGKVKFVRMELDDKGQVITPKTGAAPAAKPNAAAPSTARPAVQQQQQPPPNGKDAAARLGAGASLEAKRKAALAAELS